MNRLGKSYCDAVRGRAACRRQIEALKIYMLCACQGGGGADRVRLAHAAKIFPPERYAGAHEAMQDARAG